MQLPRKSTQKENKYLRLTSLLGFKTTQANSVTITQETDKRLWPVFMLQITNQSQHDKIGNMTEKHSLSDHSII